MGVENITVKAFENKFFLGNLSDVIEKRDINNNNEEIQFIYIIVRTAVFTVLFLTGLFGNGLVLYAINKFKYLKRPTNILLCNLCTFNIVLLIIGIKNGQIYESAAFNCAIQFIHITAMSSIVFTHVLIAIERYLTVAYLLRIRSRLSIKKTFIVLVLLNIFSLLLALPSLICTTLESQIELSLQYIIALFIIQFIIPLVIMVVIYWLTWKHLRRKNKETIQHANVPNTGRFRSFTMPNLSVSSKGRRHSEEIITKVNIEKRKARAESMYIMKTSPELELLPPKSQSLLSPAISSDRVQLNRNNTLRDSASLLQRSITSIITGENLNSKKTEFAKVRWEQTLSTFKVFFYILIVFVACLLPSHFILFANFYKVNITPILVDVLNSFIYIHVLLIPCLYSGKNDAFKKAYHHIFRVSTSKLIRKKLSVPICFTITDKLNKMSIFNCFVVKDTPLETCRVIKDEQRSSTFPTDYILPIIVVTSYDS